MPRFAAALAFLALGLPGALAQETITIDPLAQVNTTTRQGQLLTGLYATQATLEICNVEVGEPGATAMSVHRRQLQSELRMDDATGDTAYAAIKAEVEKTGVDCAEGSTDRMQAAEVVKIYSGN